MSLGERTHFIQQAGALVDASFHSGERRRGGCFHFRIEGGFDILAGGGSEVAVAIDPAREKIERRGLVGGRFFHRATVHGERPGESFGGGEQALLEVGDDELELDLFLPRGRFEMGLAGGGVFVQQAGERQFGRVFRKPVDVLLHHRPLWKPSGDLADVFLETPDHDFLKVLLRDGDAPGEPLGIEKFEQRGEAVGVAVVGSGGEEQPVLEAGGDVPDGAGDAGVDGILRTAGGRGMMRFVKDEQAAGFEVAEPVAERGGVGLINEEAL